MNRNQLNLIKDFLLKQELKYTDLNETEEALRGFKEIEHNVAYRKIKNLKDLIGGFIKYLKLYN